MKSPGRFSESSGALKTCPPAGRQAGRALRSVPFFRLQLPQIVSQDEIDIGGKLPVVLLGKNTELFDHFLIQRKANLNF
jgi:hypothetical protein